MPDIATQYRIIEEGAGWLDRRTRGRLRFDGSDRVAFLQNLLTNEITSLAHRHGVYAAYLTPQGRMISDLEIFHRGDHLLAGVPSDRAKDLAVRFDNLIFTEDVRVRDVSGEISQIAVIGRDAAATIARVFSLDRAALEALAPLAQIDAGDIFIARNDDLAAGVFDLFFPAASRSDIVSRLEASGAAEISHDMAEVLRIQLGRPAFGVDMTDETIPLEAGLLDRAISMTKGCYVGQEVIVRVLHRGGGRVAKRLVRLTFEGDVKESPAAGAPVFADSRDVGRLTSVAFSPADDRFIALGYVHRDVAEVGRQVTVGPEGAAARAEIVGFAA